MENNELFEEENSETQSTIGQMRQNVSTMDEESAARLFICDDDEEEFHERLLMIQRMNGDDVFATKVMEKYHLLKQ